jgi:hypothetical protein
MIISWRALKQLNIFAPRLCSLELLKSRIDGNESDICGKIAFCFPNLTKLKWEGPRWLDPLVLRDRLPRLQALYMGGTAPRALIENKNGGLERLQCSMDGHQDIRVQDIRIIHPGAGLRIFRSNIVMSLTLHNMSTTRSTELASLISPWVFPNLRRFRIDFCKPDLLERIMQLHKVEHMNLRFGSYHNVLKFIKKCKEPSVQQLALSSLVIDITRCPTQCDRIICASGMPKYRQKLRDELLHLAALPRLPQLRKITLSELFFDGHDIELEQQFYAKGISCDFRIVKPRRYPC